MSGRAVAADRPKRAPIDAGALEDSLVLPAGQDGVMLHLYVNSLTSVRYTGQVCVWEHFPTVLFSHVRGVSRGGSVALARWTCR